MLLAQASELELRALDEIGELDGIEALVAR
ncbi:MAG: hypothetical protein QOF69_1320, partial [Solirubrobacteraceae bacterium]|nr:hypothetical protein [Solirubrobacteraceae bacterium]